MTEGEGEKGKSEIQRSEYLKNEKNFLDEGKRVFYNYVSAIIYWIKEKLGTQVLSCLRILRNTIIIKRRPRTTTNIYDGTSCEIVYGFEP